MVKRKKYIFIITGLLLMLIIPIVCWADNETAENIGGTIPVIQKLFVSGGYTELFSDITVDDFQAGFRATNEGNIILTVLANAPWKVSARAEFKPVGTYIKPASDLFVKIKEKMAIEEGTGTGGNFNEAFLNFGPLSKEDQALWMNEESGDHCRSRIDYKVLLSPAKDIPGDYSVVVTYTISAP